MEGGYIMSLEDRLEILEETILKILKSPPEPLIYSYYMFYDEDSKLFPVSYPYELIH